MTDQASRLRAIMNARPYHIPQWGGTPALVMGSGKGGVGKSVLTLLAAGKLARAGHRVLLMDGTQNLGNLHVLLGIRPQYRLEDLLEEGGRASDLLHPVADQVWLLPSDSGAQSLYSLSPADRARLHHRLSGLYDDFDVVLIDAGSGLESAVRVATMRATRLITVTAPEPTALTDSYALIKVVTFQIPDLPIDVIVNRTLDTIDGQEAYGRLAQAAARFLRRGIHWLGEVPEDGTLRKAARETSGLLQEQPGAAAWEAMTLITSRLRLPTPMLTAVDGADLFSQAGGPAQ